jgi:hypothetical protein
VVLAVAAGQSSAADVTTDLHIDRVTVYRQGAVVTRAGEVAIRRDQRGELRLSVTDSTE